MSASTSGPLIYLLALEPSGDVLGAKLMTALSAATQGEARFAGIGGEGMAGQGLKTLFKPDELAILGIFEVIPKAGVVFRRVREVLADIERLRPDILVTIDSWGFTGRVHKALSKRGSSIKRLRYVAPQVWAWRPGRAKQLAQWIDHLLTLFPFEPPYFEKYGLESTWVGHPVVEISERAQDGARFRSKYGLAPDAPLLAVLPGSRTSEVESLSPIFGEAVRRLAERFSTLEVVIPTIPSVEADVRRWAQSLPVPGYVVVEEIERQDAVAASSAALAASGTITLELAISKIPHVIAYKVNPVSAFVFRRLAKTRYVNLINVLLDQEVVPEFLQQECRADLLAEAVAELLSVGSRRQDQLAAFDDAICQLQPSDVPPSQMAAQAILDVLKSS